jgi:hypothetical protein
VWSVVVLVVVGSLVVGVAPARAKGPQPSALRVPAQATAGAVIEIRATIKGPTVPSEWLAAAQEALLLRRVTRHRPLMWIGQDVIPVMLEPVRGHRYSALVTVPETPGRYLFHLPQFLLWELNLGHPRRAGTFAWLTVRAGKP